MTPFQTGVHRALLYVGLAYLAFVIYGSLVPLDFHSRSWGDAWQAFKDIPYLDLGIGSRADWVANILLFIPLTFMWLGILWHSKSVGVRILASGVLLAAAVALSFGIEFTQLFFPPRTVSLNDIIAESIGGCIGIALWWVSGEKVLRWLEQWSQAKGNTGLAERLLYLYLFVLFGYNLLPLDLTLSPVEIYHKWREGRVILVPFGYIFANPMQEIYGLISDVAIWAPVAFLWRLSAKRPGPSILLYVIGAAALLEFLQLFVYTRVTNVTQIITAALGAAVGLLLANLMQNKKLGGPATLTGHVTGAGRHLAWLAASASWMAVMIAIFWYPFDFHFSRELAAERLPGMLKVPFVAYYYGSEYRAATEVLHKAGFFLPLGILLGLAQPNNLSNGLRRLFKAWILLLIPLTALGIEVGQAFLPDKNADITDWMLETLGGLAGYLFISKITKSRPENAVPIAQKTIQNTHPFRMLPGVMGSLTALTAAAWLITHSALAPYNVRKLLVPDHPLLSLVLLSCFVYWAIGFPAWFALRQHQSRTVWPFAAVMLFHASIAWVLLRFSVPVEMIEKIAASPILGWPWEWELIGRFIALFGVFSFGLTSGAMAVMAFSGGKSRTPFSYWLVNAVILLPLLHWVVITNAATDNLTELMANGGGMTASLLLLFSLLILCSAGSSLAAIFSGNFRRSSLMLAAFTTLSFPLAYFSISAGTEQFIIKYGKVFSALQFLLSSNREHYAGTTELLIRYVVFHAAFIGAIALVQRPFFSGFGKQIPKTETIRKQRAEHEENPGR